MYQQSQPSVSLLQLHDDRLQRRLLPRSRGGRLEKGMLAAQARGAAGIH